MDALPEWTERQNKRGLDPLGMQNSGITLYQQLLPGISNVTLRMRYYGLYAWLSDTYARQSGSTDQAEWQRWVRRCEALYALAVTRSGGEGGVAGVEWAAKVLKGTNGEIDFSVAAAPSSPGGPKVYLEQSMGVFGGAYATQMVEMQLLAEAKQHGLLVATPDHGRPVAKAFAQSIGEEAEGLLTDAILTGATSLESLDRLGGALPSKIPDEGLEAELYRDALFGPPGGTEDSKSASRRRSLVLVLMVAKSIGAKPTPDAVRWMLFDNGLPSLTPSLEVQRLRWETYHAHDLTQLAFAGLLRLALDRLQEADSFGLTALIDTCVEELAANDALPDAPTWSEWVQVNAYQPDYQAMERGLTHVRSGGMLAPKSAGESLRILAGLQARVGSRPDLAEEIAKSFGQSQFARSIRSELAFLQSCGDLPVVEVLRLLLRERVLRRHSWVAMQKLRRRDYTFLFEADDGRLSLRAKYDPVFTTPRLGPAITFLEDIGLLDAGGPTALGITILEGAT